MSEWSGKTKGGVFGYGFFICLIKCANIKIAYFFLKFVAFYFLLFSDKKAVKFYFNKIHGLKGTRLIRNIYRNYVLMGETLIDKIAFMFKPDNTFTFDYEGENNLVKMAEEGRGGVLIGAHMGNWEVAGNLFKRIDVKVNVVLLDAEHENIKSLFERYGIIRNFNIIPVKNDFSHLYEIKQALDNNEFIVMHGDRTVGDSNSAVVIDFFGKPASFPSGPLYIASKYKAPVSFVYTLKETSTHYHFYATTPQFFEYPANIKTRKEVLKDMVKVYVENLEKMVHRYPAQWFNYFPFWEEEIAGEMK